MPAFDITVMAILLWPGYSYPSVRPQTHYLHEGLNAAEEFQREYEPEPLHVDLGVRTERLGWWGFSKHRTSL